MIHHYRFHLILKKKNEIEQRLNSDIAKIYNWSTKWLVDFNPQKTKCMLFSTNQGNIKPQILFNNEDVEFVVNKGPNTDPCGTPPLMFPTSERQFCRTTF
jgi:hypothetical protein